MKSADTLDPSIVFTVKPVLAAGEDGPVSFGLTDGNGEDYGLYPSPRSASKAAFDNGAYLVRHPYDLRVGE